MADGEVIDLTGDSDGDAPPPPRRLQRGGRAYDDEAEDDIIDLTGDTDEEESASDSDEVIDVTPAAPPAAPRAPGGGTSVYALLFGAGAHKRPREAQHAPPPLQQPPPQQQQQQQQRRPHKKRKGGGGGGGGGGRRVSSEDVHSQITSIQLFRRRPALQEFAAVSTTFADARAYVDAFEALLVEEAREGVRNGWAAECAAGAAGRPRIHAVKLVLISSVSAAGGWLMAEVLPAEGGALPRFQDGAVAVLSSQRPGRAPLDELRAVEAEAQRVERAAPAGAAATASHAGGASALMHFAGFTEVRGHYDNGGGAGGSGHAPTPTLRVRFHLAADDAEEDAAAEAEAQRQGGAGGSAAPPPRAPPPKHMFQPSDVLSRLRDGGGAEGHTWYLAVTGRLASSPAEHRALTEVAHLSPPLLRALLNPLAPPMLPPPAAAFTGAIVFPPQMLPPPPDYATQAPPPLCADLASRGGDGFAKHLSRCFNEQQRAAIQWVAAAGDAAMHASARGGAGGAGGAGGSAAPAARWPITLVQGCALWW
jgi:hypothetical protein